MGDIDELVAQWEDAERRGDITALDVVLDTDFRGVGPAGFVLTQTQTADYQGHDASGRLRPLAGPPGR